MLFTTTQRKKNRSKAIQKLSHEKHRRTYLAIQNNKSYNTAVNKKKMYKLYLHIYIKIHISYKDLYIKIYK